MAKDYDLIVIGGGSGGISCARESAKLGAKVVLFDHVSPSPYGSKWGLGGTCVNVGCIPKKLMHYTSLLAAHMQNAKALGWKLGTEQPTHDWSKMVQTVQNHIRSLNFGYRVDMMKNKVNYVNSFASLIDKNTVKYTDKDGKEQKISGENIVIAVGGRPKYPNVPGAKEYGITSDDVFSLAKAPGKTLIVGASYIALETAGFLTELGYEVKVAVRSIVLRGFDRQCAGRIKAFMEKCGTVFYDETVPTKIDKSGDRIVATLSGKRSTSVEEFDTVLFAVGRQPSFAGLGLAEAGVELLPGGKISTLDEQTSAGSIFALGDSIDKQELTPVAIQAGQLLARRLMGVSPAKMDYNLVPTTVFTPLEYGTVGYSEEEANAKFGKDNINVYLSSFSSLENAACHRCTKSGEDFGNTDLAKLVCLKNEHDRVVGFHFLGDNAGEVTGGFALALRLKATKKDFDSTVGIHPTVSESLTTLSVLKSSGEKYEASGC